MKSFKNEKTKDIQKKAQFWGLEKRRWKIVNKRTKFQEAFPRVAWLNKRKCFLQDCWKIEVCVLCKWMLCCMYVSVQFNEKKFCKKSKRTFQFIHYVTVGTTRILMNDWFWFSLNFQLFSYDGMSWTTFLLRLSFMKNWIHSSPHFWKLTDI